MLNLTNSKVLDFRTAELAANVVVTNNYILKRVPSPTNPALSAVTIATGAANEDIVGVAHISPIASTSRAVVGEEHIRGAVDVVAINNAGYVANSLYIYNLTVGAVVPGTAITSIGTNGTVTFNSAGVGYPAPTDVLQFSYRRSVTLSELSQEGLPIDFANRVNGQNGAVEFATAKAILEVDFFDTAVAYAIGQKVYPTTEGIPTSTVSAGGIAIGTVSVVPTAEYPALGITIDLNY